MDEQLNVFQEPAQMPPAPPKRPQMSQILKSQIELQSQRIERLENLLIQIANRPAPAPPAPATIPQQSGSDVAALLMAINQMNSNALTNAVTLFKTAFEMAPATTGPASDEIGLKDIIGLAPLIMKPPAQPQIETKTPLPPVPPMPPELQKDGKTPEVPKL